MSWQVGTWTKTMDTLKTEGAKFVQARVQEGSLDGAPAAAQRAAAEEFVRSKVAVDMVDIAKQMSKSTSGCAELERMAADQAGHEQRILPSSRQEMPLCWPQPYKGPDR